MTRRMLSRLVRSIKYRRRLSKDLPDLEARLITYMQGENLQQIKIGGYKVERTDGDITFSQIKTESMNYDQLKFDSNKPELQEV